LCTQCFLWTHTGIIHIESYRSHDQFCKENSEAVKIRQLSAQEPQDNATKWLQDGGDVAVSIELWNMFNLETLCFIHVCIYVDIGQHSYYTSLPPNCVWSIRLSHEVQKKNKSMPIHDYCKTNINLWIWNMAELDKN